MGRQNLRQPWQDKDVVRTLEGHPPPDACVPRGSTTAGSSESDAVVPGTSARVHPRDARNIQQVPQNPAVRSVLNSARRANTAKASHRSDSNESSDYIAIFLSYILVSPLHP